MKINEIAVLAAFKATGFAGSIKDEQTQREITNNHGTEEDVFSVSKNLFPASTCGDDNAFTRIRSFITASRKWHHEITLPFERGWQILPLAAQPEHDFHIQGQQNKLNGELKDDLRSEYRGLVENAKRAHNGTFDATHYPPVNEFLEKFTLSASYRPVPSGDSMASKVFSKRMDAIRSKLEEDVTSRLQSAYSETWRRLLEPMVDLAGRLVDPSTRRFKTIVEHVLEIANRIPVLNITADPALNEAALRIKQVLAGVSAEALNENQPLRMETAQHIITLASSLGSFSNRKLAA